MIPYNIKDQSGKEVLKFSLPQSWNEITLKQMITWEQETKLGPVGFCKQLEILTGIPEADWFNCTITSLDTMLLPNLKWLQTPMNVNEFTNMPVPDEVTIDGKMIQIPKDFDLKTFGQKITFQTEMAKHIIKNQAGEITGVEFEFFPTAIAIYLYPGDPFIDTRAFEYAAKVETLLLHEAYPIATFFLRRFIASQSATVNY